MKLLLTLTLILFIASISNGQEDSISFNEDRVFDLSGYTFRFKQDSLTASRFISDSLGNTYMVEYIYAGNRNLTVDTLSDTTTTLHHYHYIALVNIISFKGNRKKIIASNIKAIYSPTECSSDNAELWKKKLYQILNKKK